MDALFRWILIGSSRTRDMILYLIPSYGFHESRPGACLHRCAIESELLWDSEVTDELSERVSDVISIDFWDWVCNFESTLMLIYLRSDITSEGFDLSIRRVGGKFTIQSFHPEDSVCTVPSTDWENS